MIAFTFYFKSTDFYSSKNQLTKFLCLLKYWHNIDGENWWQYLMLMVNII